MSAARKDALRLVRPQSDSRQQHLILGQLAGFAARPLTALCRSLKPNAPANVASSRTVRLVLRKTLRAADGEIEAVTTNRSVTAGYTLDMEPAERPVVVLPARYVLLPLANALTGYSVKAMERKIERGDWQEGKLWKRAPDGHVMIDMVGYQEWVESR